MSKPKFNDQEHTRIWEAIENLRSDFGGMRTDIALIKQRMDSITTGDGLSVNVHFTPKQIITIISGVIITVLSVYGIGRVI